MPKRGPPVVSYNPQNPNGQATSANSEPVVIASDQSTVPVSVSGVATAANQATANTSLASIDGKITAVNTGAVTVSSSVLPTGAATAAKQPALGTAGAASADVITVQGKAGMTALIVDGSGVTQPVSGTVSIAANQSVNVNQIAGTTTDTNSGNKSAGTQRVVLATDQPQLTNALKVDGSAVTQPVSAASLPLPALAATSTKQSDGSQKSQVVDGSGNVIGSTGNALDVNIKTSAVTQTISGTVTANAGTNLNTSALALETGGNLATVKTNTDNLSLAQGSTTSGQKGNLIQGAVTTSAPTYITAQTSPLSLTTAGALRVDNSANTQPVSGTVSITANSTVNVAQVNGVTTQTGTGTAGTGTQRVAVASDSSIGSNSATGSAVPANAFFVGGKDTSGNLQGLSTANANGDATGAGSILASTNWLYNGSTWDRVRSIINATNSTGTGIAAAGLVGQFDDVSPTAITENQFGNVRMSANRNLYGTIRDAAGNERGVNVTAGNALVVDGSASTQPVSGTVSITANSSVNLAQVAGGTTINSGVTGALATGGDTAAAATDAGNPVKVGGIAKSSEPTAVTTGQRANFYTDLVGKQVIIPYANPENFVNGTTAAITDTTSTSVIASAGGSLRNYITSILVTNSHATVGTFVKILDGASIIYEGYAAAAGGGFTASLPVPLRGTAATAVNAQCVTTGANVIVSCAGYKGV